MAVPDAGAPSSSSLAVRPSEQLALVSPSPNVMFLGHSAPELGEIEGVFQARLAHVMKYAPHGDQVARANFLTKNALLSFDEYRDAIADAERRRGDRGYSAVLEKLGEGHALLAFLQRWYDPKRHPPTLQGWAQYLVDVCPAFADRLPLTGRPVELPEEVREMHTLITAASGQGKSELLKTLIHHYVAHDSAAVVLLDPHGVLASEIARWPDFRHGDRLAYIEPDLVSGQTVGINPFDARGLNAQQLSKLAELIGDTIGELSSDLTSNMQAVATGCARLLLEDGKATFFDLLDLLTDPPKKGEATPHSENRARLIAKGRNHPDRAMAWFFSGHFEADSLKSARTGIINRLFLRLLSPDFQHMTCGRPTLNLQELIAQRKVVVFNLQPLGPQGAAAMGRLIVALVAAIGFRRGGTPEAGWTPCHLFVDEAQTMASPTMADILFQLRKFRIHLTLAQQVEGVGFDEVGQKAIANSTAIKFVGADVKAALRPVFGDRDPPELDRLKRGEFWMRWGRDGEPTLVQVRSDFAKVEKNAPPPYRMTDAEWEAVRARQLKHYRDAVEAPSPAPSPLPKGTYPQTIRPVAPVVRPTAASPRPPVRPQAASSVATPPSPASVAPARPASLPSPQSRPQPSVPPAPPITAAVPTAAPPSRPVSTPSTPMIRSSPPPPSPKPNPPPTAPAAAAAPPPAPPSLDPEPPSPPRRRRTLI